MNVTNPMSRGADLARTVLHAVDDEHGRYANLAPRLVHDIDELCDEYGSLGVMNAFAEMYPTTWSMRSDVCLDSDDCPPHGIPRADELRTRHYFLDPVSQLQVLVNVWPGGILDAAFETEPGVFGPPISARRTETEVCG